MFKKIIMKQKKNKTVIIIEIKNNKRFPSSSLLDTICLFENF